MQEYHQEAAVTVAPIPVVQYHQHQHHDIGTRLHKFPQDFIKAEFVTDCNQAIVIDPHVDQPDSRQEAGQNQQAGLEGQDAGLDSQGPGLLSSSSSSFVSTLGQGSSEQLNRVKRESVTVGSNRPVYRLEKEGIYLLVVHVAAVQNTQPYTASVHVEVRAPSGGYLSVTDWPLLPFYGCMCGLYVVLGLAWLVVCGLYWRDILRIQYWIGGVCTVLR